MEKKKNSYWENIFEKNGKVQIKHSIILKKVPIFSDLKKSELREFERIIHQRRYKKDEVVFYEGEPGLGMYIIESGTIKIFKDYDNKLKEELATLFTGDFIGEMALLDESPRSATAVANEETKLIGVFRPDLFDLLEKKPRLGNKILLKLAQMIAERLRFNNVELQEIKLKLEKSGIIK
ncbi:hypothetical protein B6I21_05575 [candidate division KSB1 bacterium 4572_119]|nr:MAG: hypothetical protein B6I21_05575 [candidate division KSB1 bacterium 4572_119]